MSIPMQGTNRERATGQWIGRDYIVTGNGREYIPRTLVLKGYAFGKGSQLARHFLVKGTGSAS